MQHAQQCRAHVPANIRSQTKKSTSIEAKVNQAPISLLILHRRAFSYFAMNNDESFGFRRGRCQRKRVIIGELRRAFEKRRDCFRFHVRWKYRQHEWKFRVGSRKCDATSRYKSKSKCAVQPGQVKGLKRGLNRREERG